MQLDTGSQYVMRRKQTRHNKVGAAEAEMGFHFEKEEESNSFPSKNKNRHTLDTNRGPQKLSKNIRALTRQFSKNGT